MLARWARDEAILGLDVVLSTDKKYFNATDPEIVELSQLLNRLPIIPEADRHETFRNPTGVSIQLSGVLSGLREVRADLARPRVGRVFFDVHKEFGDDIEGLHRIALAIRRCEPCASEVISGRKVDMEGFPEGVVLSAMHLYIERRFRDEETTGQEKCDICWFNPSQVYTVGGTLEKHLTIRPDLYSPDMHTEASDFLTVCPNCHRTLHLARPWLSRETCEHILKQ